MLTAVDQILAHAATGAEIDPDADQGLYEYVLIDESNVPAEGSYYFDPAEQIDAFVKTWKSQYGL